MTLWLFLISFESCQKRSSLVSWSNVLRVVGAALLLVVALAPTGALPVVPKNDPVIDLDSCAALVLTDTGDGTTVSTPVWFESTVQDALNEYRFQWKRWDDSVDLSKQVYLEQHWKAAYQKAMDDSNGVRPWLLIGNEEGGESLVLPESPEALVDLIVKYGGEE